MAEAHGLLKSVKGTGRGVWNGWRGNARAEDPTAHNDGFSLITQWSPVPCVSWKNIACGAFGNTGGEINVDAGDMIDVVETFGYHPGVARWFLRRGTDGDLNKGWMMIGRDLTAKNLRVGSDQVHYVKIPQCIPSGRYMLRVELIAVHIYRQLQCFSRCATLNIENKTPNSKNLDDIRPKVSLPGHIPLNNVWWRGDGLGGGGNKPWDMGDLINCPDTFDVEREDLNRAMQYWGNTGGYPGPQFDQAGDRYVGYPSDNDRRNGGDGWKRNVYPKPTTTRTTKTTRTTSTTKTTKTTSTIKTTTQKSTTQKSTSKTIKAITSKTSKSQTSQTSKAVIASALKREVPRRERI